MFVLFVGIEENIFATKKQYNEKILAILGQKNSEYRFIQTFQIYYNF